MVQLTTELNDDNRIAELTTAFGEEGLAYLIENYGAPDRVTAIEFVSGRPVMIGDCPCAGSNCRGAWGWVYETRDLNMAGHRGSLKAKPCSHMPTTHFDPDTGEFGVPTPYGMDDSMFHKFRSSNWGKGAGAGMQGQFLKANLASAEGQEKRTGLYVDHDPTKEASE